ncbi:hypothetical protein BDY21DRAFT_340132 [Lineolata rhizophorae]|uniref:Uncharacterized protein n=1 Tax=Lineolata rhizophorae TaxID=578093 RepID=A0A6A6P5Y2_9PEZI|nr:hypothetical protein BDY21DRAFT_340132 [Lineolata rhizophorae]
MTLCEVRCNTSHSGCGRYTCDCLAFECAGCAQSYSQSSCYESLGRTIHEQPEAPPSEPCGLVLLAPGTR